jgi:hypothetical protein
MTLSLLMSSINVQSATYYISSSIGDNANDGISETIPWQTIDKVNSIEFADNSTLLFKRGDIFRGAISPNKNPTGLTYGAYESGENTIIAGSVVITGWTSTAHPSLGANVYEADVSSLLLGDDGIHHLFVDGELMTIARYPNVDSPAEKNWLTVGAGAGTDAFTDPQLVAYGKPDDYWKDAILRIRDYSWTFKAFRITGYTALNGKIMASSLGDQLPEWGYFLDDKLEELDHLGEWYHDAIAKKVYFYPRGGVDPNTLLIEGSTYDIGINIVNQKNNTTIENLIFRHFTEKGVNISGSDDCIVRNNHFEYNFVGLFAWNAPNVLVTNNIFDNQLKDSMILQASTGFDVKNSIAEKNQITNTAMFRGYGRMDRGVYQGVGISVFGKAYTVRQNIIERSSHAGMKLVQDGQHLIENNIIRQSLLILNDGGAIVIGSDGNIIRGNFLSESVGNIDESNGCGSLGRTPCSKHDAYGMGIGANPEFRDNVIEGNTIFNNSHQGIRLNSFILIVTDFGDALISWQ